MSGLTLERPLWLVISVVALVVAAWMRRRAGTPLTQGRLHRWRALPVTVRQRASGWVGPLWGVACLGIGAGLAGPLQRTLEEPTASVGLDVVLLVDVSSSMALVGPDGTTRLDAARAVLEEFVAGRPQDRLALMTFARSARLRCPATLDHALLREWIQQLEATDPTGEEDRTALGVALATAARFAPAGGTATPVVILLTDGENNIDTITPEEGAMLCESEGVRVYAVGLTGEGGANPGDLARLAEATGGRGFEAADLAGLRRAYAEIGRREAAPLVATGPTRWLDRSRWLLVPGALLFMVLLVLDRTWLLRMA